MECPECGKDCARMAEDVLAEIDHKVHGLPQDALRTRDSDKAAPLRDLPEQVERCQQCGRAPLDAVMLDALRILREFGLRDEEDTLRSVGSPLIAFGYPLAFSPRLGPQSLIIVGERLTRDAARAMTERIPEIKGVILSRGRSWGAGILGIAK